MNQINIRGLWRYLIIVVFSWLFFILFLAKQGQAAQKEALPGDDWLHAEGSRICDQNGKEVWLTGVNWFGYNTGTNTFDGLWSGQCSLKKTVESIANHGFNFIRVPISSELLLEWKKGAYPAANYNAQSNPELTGKNSQEIFDYFLSLCRQNGVKVMMDIHSAETNAAGHTVNLWYTANIRLKDYYASLEYLAKRYKNDDTILLLDLKNEPHGKPSEGVGNFARWDNSKASNNWKYIAETAAKKVLNQNPKLLIVIEGVEATPKQKALAGSVNDGDYDFNWWGGNLRGVKDYPVELGKYNSQIVYSPHDYGPSVYAQPWFSKKFTYSSLMRDCWEPNWFYIQKQGIAPLLIGEWGGFMEGDNLRWMKCLRKLIVEQRIHHSFWCLNANSGDTGGLLKDDFFTWDLEKYKFVKKTLWQKNGRFVGLDHKVPLGKNGMALSS